MNLQKLPCTFYLWILILSNSLDYCEYIQQLRSSLCQSERLCACCTCLSSIQHKMINNIAGGHVRKCGSTTGMKGGRGERLSVPWKSYQLPPPTPFLPSHFQLSALFSRIIDGACEVQRTGMKMSQSLGSKTRTMAKGGAAGGTTCSIYCCVRYEGREEEKWSWSPKWSETGLILHWCYTVFAVLEEAVSSFTSINLAITEWKKWYMRKMLFCSTQCCSQACTDWCIWPLGGSIKRLWTHHCCSDRQIRIQQHEHSLGVKHLSTLWILVQYSLSL